MALPSINPLYNDAIARQKALGLMNMSRKLPGYSEMSGLYNQYRNQQSPDYMEKFAGMVNPMDALKGFLDPNSSGGYGPIGGEDLLNYGRGMYELFDKFKPGMEYIAENQGVGQQELANMLGTSSAGFAQNVANQEAQQQRAMGRMGIDPTSGAWQAGQGQRAMQNAANLSGLQQNVRNDARAQDWQERLQAAGIGLQAGQQGTDALNTMTGYYGNMLGTVGDLYGNYMNTLGNLAGVTEKARMGDKQFLGGLTQSMANSVPAYQNMQQSARALQSLQSLNQQWKPFYQ